MVASSRVILAVVVVSAVAIAQIEARPSSDDWTTPFEDAFKNLTSSVTKFVGDQSVISENAKKSLTSYADTLKSELSSFSKKLESNPDVSAIINNATDQWHSAVNTLTKNLPADLTPEKLNEKFQETQKTVSTHANDLWKKVQGNTDVEKEIKDFTKKQFDSLSEKYQAIQKTLTEGNKA